MARSMALPAVAHARLPTRETGGFHSGHIRAIRPAHPAARLGRELPPCICGRRATRFVDDAGDTVIVAAPVTRVASLIPATTELLFAIGAGDAVVGRTTWCDYPPAAAPRHQPR